MPTYRNGQTGEIIETLTYAPGLQGGTDLEGATKTITNTSENATPDYTSIHTLAAPTDARIAVLRGCMRLTVTIDSWGSGGVQLNYRVKRGGASVSTGVLAVAAATGQKIISWDITTLITGAQTNTLFLWVDAGTCVISEVTMWTGVGSMQATATELCLSISHYGFVKTPIYWSRIGTGNFTCRVSHSSGLASSGQLQGEKTTITTNTSVGSSSFDAGFWSSGVLYVCIYGPTVTTDLPYIAAMTVVLASRFL